MLLTRTYLSWGRQSFAPSAQTLRILLLLIFFTPAAAAQSIPTQPNLKALFEVVGRMHNIDPNLLEAMAEVESGEDALCVSSKGALGLMQLMPATASSFSVLDPFNPVANLMGAADFIDYLRNRLANNLNVRGLPTLLAAYNAGPGAVEKYGGIPPYAERQRYVHRVIDRYASGLSAQSTVAPVLILGPKPYLVRLNSGSSAIRPEPVLISIDGDGSVLKELAALRRTGRYFVAAMGTRTEPWLRRDAARTYAEVLRH